MLALEQAECDFCFLVVGSVLVLVLFCGSYINILFVIDLSMVNDAAETRSESAKHLPVIYMLFSLMIFECISLYLMLNPILTLI